MKTHLVSAIFMLGIGIAIGWFARGPSSTKETPEVATAKVSQQPAASTDTAQDTYPTPASRGKSAQRESGSEEKTVAEALSESGEPDKMDNRISRMMESMAKRQRDRLDQHVARVDASVSLTTAQKEKLTAWLDEKTNQAAEFDVMAISGNPLEAENAQTTFSPEGMESFITELLSEDQKAEFDRFRARDSRAKIDALALKNLSQIQKAVDFSDEQRDQIYQILSGDAEQRLANVSETDKMSSFMHESMGIEMDPYDLGVNTLMQDVMGTDMESVDMEALKDTKALAQKLRDELAVRIDRKVELLRPALNDTQLEQYRTELRARGGGFVEQMIMGLEMVEDSDFIIRNKAE